MLTHAEIIMKLIGPVQPVGETRADENRLNNLRDLCELTWVLIDEINEAATNQSRHQHSMKEIGKFAQETLNELKGEYFTDNVKVWDSESGAVQNSTQLSCWRLFFLVRGRS